MPKGYCMHCRDTKEMKNPKGTKMKNGRKATVGECPTCGAKIYRIGG